MIANPDKAPVIEWAMYKKHVPVAGMVDNFQKAYEALKVPYPADTVTAKIADQEQTVKAEVADFKKVSETRIKQ